MRKRADIIGYSWNRRGTLPKGEGKMEKAKEKSGEEKKGLTLMLVASGSGTDANAIMRSWRNGCIPEVENIYLVSTKKGVGCLDMARKSRVRSFTIPWKTYSLAHMNEEKFNGELTQKCVQLEVDLVFLVGCVHKVKPVMLYRTYNIHPADPVKHGGLHMYGLDVHEHVLAEIKDLIWRGKATAEQQFYTYPTVHEIDEQYDHGAPLLAAAVPIPKRLIQELVANMKPLKELAGDLQQHVLPFEWAMLPGAVRLAAKLVKK